MPASVWEMGRLAAKPVGALLMVTVHGHPHRAWGGPTQQVIKAQVHTAEAELRERLLGHQLQKLQ